jgi:hypothetical protein
MNELGGFRNSFTVALTGLDIEAKADFAQASFWTACPHGPDDFESVTSRVIPTNKPDPTTQEEATAIWRLTVKDSDERKVGRPFSDAMVHTALAGIPGMYGLGGSPGPGQPFGVYRPATVPSDLVPQYVTILGSDTRQVDSVAPVGSPIEIDLPASSSSSGKSGTRPVPLGTVFGARSGDKGGNANLGIFARSEEAWAWLDNELTTDRLRRLLPETTNMSIERHRFPKIWSLNFVVHGLLEEGVAASSRQDAQAKALGEWLRARVVELPVSLL